MCPAIGGLILRSEMRLRYRILGLHLQITDSAHTGGGGERVYIGI